MRKHISGVSSLFTGALMFALCCTLLLAALTRIAYVIDGDTVKLVSGLRLRYDAIDAAELHARCPAELQAALAAKNRLEGLIASGRRVTLDLDWKADQYGRLLGRVIVDGTDTSAVLFNEGLVRAYSRGKRKNWC